MDLTDPFDNLEKILNFQALSQF